MGGWGGGGSTGRGGSGGGVGWGAGWGCRGEEEQEKLEQSTEAEHSGVYRVLEQGVRETDCSIGIFQTDLDFVSGTDWKGVGLGRGEGRVEGDGGWGGGGGGGVKADFGEGGGVKADFEISGWGWE